tara:strand:- start:230 stop:742 length:513 start_codon:yes stop_codon:yes gene_type:complete
MYKVTAYFRDHKVTEMFHDLYDAIDFKDSADAHYPKSVIFEEVKSMREFVYNSWNGVMNMDHNPLRHIPDLQTRHLIMQVLAWMWCITFAMLVGSWTVFGVSAIAHVFLLGAIAVTVGTFETAKRKPNAFKFVKGYHSHGRGRVYTIYRDRKGNAHKVELPANDPGGEHE